MYNELAILKMTQSLNSIAKNPPFVFREEIMKHFKATSSDLLRRLDAWLQMSECQNGLPANANEKSTNDAEARELKSIAKNTVMAPDFPLLPGSKGFCISLKKAITAFKATINEI